MSAAFTPGPWRVSGGRIAYVAIEVIVDGVKKVVGHVPHMGWMSFKLANANARLIAAAPELYEALAAVMPSPSGLPGELIDPKWAAAKAALAKARGEQ